MISFEITRLASPHFLYLLAVIPLMVALYFYRCRKGGAAIRISTVQGVAAHRKTARYYLRHLPLVFRILAVGAIVFALARPQNSQYGSTSRTEGIDIMLAVDVSGSMLARDFQPDRMTAAKQTAAKFITDRPNDRIGIVVFAGESFTQSPLTTDKAALLNLMSRVRSGVIEDGTAIGNGLATAVNRLKESNAKSKVVILLTDGVNNSGQIAPMTAAEIASTLGIKVYTIGVGTRGTAPSPVMDRWGRISFRPMPVEIDEDLLREISAMTGGEYFRAVDNTSLESVYEEINRLETTTIETSDYTRYNELFAGFVLVAILLVILEFLTSKFLLKRIP